MDAQSYRQALATLGLTQKAAGEWLGVSEKTAKRYATKGPSGPAARAMWLALSMLKITRIENDDDGPDWEEIEQARFVARCALWDLTPRAG